MVSATLHNGDISESSIGIFFENSYCEGIYTELLHKGIIKNTFQSYDATLKNYFPKCKVFSLCLKNDEI